MISFTKDVVSPDGVPTSYHVIDRIEVSKDIDKLTVFGQSWSNKPAHSSNYPAVENWSLHSPVTGISGLEDFTQKILGFVLGSTTYSGGVLYEENPSLALEESRRRKNLQINAWRLAANQSSFTFAGKEIAVDPLSRSDIDATHGLVLMLGTLPPGWPGAWKAVDNTYVAIPDVATWGAMYAAMVAQGMANFTRSQALKAYMNDPARTQAEVEAITWEMAL